MLNIYLGIIISWVILLIIAILWRKKKIGRLFKNLAFILFLFFAFELVVLFGFKIRTGQWLFNKMNNPNVQLIEHHPYLIGVPRADVSVEENGIRYSHNSLGRHIVRGFYRDIYFL